MTPRSDYRDLLSAIGSRGDRAVASVAAGRPVRRSDTRPAASVRSPRGRGARRECGQSRPRRRPASRPGPAASGRARARSSVRAGSVVTDVRACEGARRALAVRADPIPTAALADGLAAAHERVGVDTIGGAGLFSAACVVAHVRAPPNAGRRGSAGLDFSQTTPALVSDSHGPEEPKRFPHGHR